MRSFIILPYVGVGPLRFGMSPAEVRTALGATGERFRRTPHSREADAFTTEGVFVYYDEAGRCEAVEMTSPAKPEFGGRELLGKQYNDTATFIRTLDPDMREEAAGLTALGLGIGLYCSGAGKNSDLAVEAVIAFKRGYFG
jgi:hypothetical protein